MACLSPSPSGRRLSELLEEQQEPFSLDLHLLEKGCASSRLLDGYDAAAAALCWPAGPGRNDAAAAVLKRLTSSKKKHQKQQPAGGGLLKLLLSKILHGSKAAAAAKKKKKPVALQFSDSFKMAANNPAAVAPAPDNRLGKVKTTAAGSQQVKTEKEKEETTECSYSDDYSDEYYDYDEEEKQLSPVSVLEHHPFESSPVHGKLSNGNGKLSPSKNAAMDILRELTQLLARSDDLVKDSAAAADDAIHDDDDEEEYYYGYHTSPKSGATAYWEAHRTELARVPELVAAEVPNSRLDAAAAVLVPEREDVGAGVAAAVFEALLQELVVDLFGSTC